MKCACGHEEDRHATMHKQTGPCMKCRCSNFTTEAAEAHTKDLPEVTQADVDAAVADLLSTEEELSHP